jgi:tetratricopeptide (TPR) repeat protein
MFTISKKEWIPLLICVILTLICFYPSLGNDFQVMWDDDDYILKNPYIQSLSLENIFRIFSVTLSGNYHPITLLSNAVEYYFFGFNPFLYHLDNLILHLLNTSLVYLFFFLLRKKVSMAFFIALVFGIHPMHVESVAWLSERKDLLYALFFLISMIAYLIYIRRKERIYLYITFVSFILSVLSKSAGIVLPLVLIIIEMMEGRKLNWTIIKNKWLFLSISFLFGILAIYTQKLTGSVQSHPEYNIIERIFFILYGYVFYLWKFFIPAPLSALHLYPSKIDGWIPLQYYLAPIIIIDLIVLLFFINKRKTQMILGLLFYTACIGLVLQIVPLGPSLVSERFSYIPYIGVSYFVYILMLDIYEYMIENGLKWINICIYCIAGIYFVSLGYLSFERSKVWKNSIVLIKDALDKNDTGEYTYWMRGNLDFHEKNYASAIQNFDALLQLKPGYADAYHNRGYTRFIIKDYEGAVSDYDSAIARGVKGVNTYIDRAYARYMLKDYSKALEDYNFVILKEPLKAEAYYYRGDMKAAMHDTLSALKDFNKALELNPAYTEVIASRGMMYYQKRDFASAEKDFSTLLKLKPEMIELHNFRGICRMNQGNFSSAMQDFYEVISQRPQYAEAYVNRGLLKQKMGSRNAACDDWKQAAVLKNTQAENLIREHCNK